MPRRESAAGKTGRGGLSEQTLLHHHRVLSEALKRAERLKLRQGNPCADVQAPRPIRAEVRVLDEAQTMQLLQAAAGSRLYAPILVTVTTGLRLGELLVLRREDVDLDGAELAVNRTLQGVKGQDLIRIRPRPRTSRRKVALPPVAVEVLRAHLVEQKKERLQIGQFWEDNGLVFPAEEDSPWGPDSLSHQFSKLAAKAGFALTFHGLRHTHAMHLLRAGIPPKVASARLGHRGSLSR
jgi:integrase